MQEITTADGHLFSASENLGQTVVIKPIEYRPSIPTSYGARPAFKADVVVLSGPHAGTYFESVLLFQKRLITQCQDATDGDVTGELVRVPVYEGSDNTMFEVAASDSSIRLAAVFGV